MQLFGRPIVLEKSDTYTVRFVSPGPHPLLPRILAIHSGLSGQASELGGAEGMGVFAPKHYLSRFHPKYAPGGQAAVQWMAAEAKFPDWASFFKARNDWTQNADLPVVTPWTVVQARRSGPRTSCSSATPTASGWTPRQPAPAPRPDLDVRRRERRGHQRTRRHG
jgi:peptide/nickel transport system substrate-binding protein